DWVSYDERLTSFLHLDKVPEEGKVHDFLSFVGPKTYGLLKSLTAPSLQSSKIFDELRRILGDHLAPRPSVIGERAKYYRRSQTDTESIPDFVAELRRLSQLCDFEGVLNEGLRDRFVCGVQRVDTQKVLFAEDKKLTFGKAVKRALRWKLRQKN
ncbi:transposon, putative, partial [Ixodes scapularis]